MLHVHVHVHVHVAEILCGVHTSRDSYMYVLRLGDRLTGVFPVFFLSGEVNSAATSAPSEMSASAETSASAGASAETSASSPVETSAPTCASTGTSATAASGATVTETALVTNTDLGVTKKKLNFNAFKIPVTARANTATSTYACPSTTASTDAGRSSHTSTSKNISISANARVSSSTSAEHAASTTSRLASTSTNSSGSRLTSTSANSITRTKLCDRKKQSVSVKPKTPESGAGDADVTRYFNVMWCKLSKKKVFYASASSWQRCEC